MKGLSEKIVSLPRLQTLCKQIKNKGLPLVLTSGCFDLLHGGHTIYINQASDYGNLVVGINSDIFVQKLKGMYRPIRNEYDRALTMAGFRGVKYVTVFDCNHELIRTVNPDIYIMSKTSHCSIWNDPKRLNLLDNLGVDIKELGGEKVDSTTDMIRRSAIIYQKEAYNYYA